MAFPHKEDKMHVIVSHSIHLNQFQFSSITFYLYSALLMDINGLTLMDSKQLYRNIEILIESLYSIDISNTRQGSPESSLVVDLPL